MRGQVIGERMPHGYAGSYARQPDMVVDTHPMEGTERILFGAPVAVGTAGAAKAWAADSTGPDFLGIAVREVKSATDYLNQNAGSYRPGEAVPVMKRGCVNVICQAGTPAPGGKVYVRVAVNEVKPNLAIGGFEAAADTAGSVSYTTELVNCQWKGGADANRVAELRILTMINA